MQTALIVNIASESCATKTCCKMAAVARTKDGRTANDYFLSTMKQGDNRFGNVHNIKKVQFVGDIRLND